MSQMEFLSTPSARRATHVVNCNIDNTPISIHALREEGDPGQHPNGRGTGISIHALREEGDQNVLNAQNDSLRISIHALREEGDPAGRT